MVQSIDCFLQIKESAINSDPLFPTTLISNKVDDRINVIVIFLEIRMLAVEKTFQFEEILHSDVNDLLNNIVDS